MEAVMCFDHDSSFLPTKCGRTSGDRISELPDDILVYILSFLPLKMVVATSAVSRRWSDLWKHTPNLVFVNRILERVINLPVRVPNCKHPHGLWRSRKNVKWVNLVLKSHKALSLKELTLSVYVDKESQFQYCKWLDYAFSRRVERLELDLQFTSCDFNKISAKSSISINSGGRFLKELTLKSLSMSGESIELFLANCPLLERLILERVKVTSDVLVGGGLLKHLDLLCRSCYSHRVSVRVSAPNLTRLGCDYDLDKLFLGDAPNVVHADFNCDYLDTTHQIAKTAAQLEILTINLPNPTMALPVPQMPKLKELVLNFSEVDENFLCSVVGLIQASPLLEKFILKTSDDQYIDENCAKFPIQVIDLEHRRLHAFEFSGFYSEAADHLELVRYIVDNCVALEEISIVPFVPLEDADENVDEDDSSWIEYHLRPPLRIASCDMEEVAARRRDASLHAMICTERVLAGKLPHHIKLHLIPSE